MRSKQAYVHTCKHTYICKAQDHLGSLRGYSMLPLHLQVPSPQKMEQILNSNLISTKFGCAQQKYRERLKKTLRSSEQLFLVMGWMFDWSPRTDDLVRVPCALACLWPFSNSLKTCLRCDTGSNNVLGPTKR